VNIIELILKQMRQRLLSTFLTCLSITLGVALAVSIMIMRHEGQSVFAQTDYGFNLLVGPKASPLQLVLNTIYHMDVSPGNIPYSLYEDMVTGRPLSADGKKNPFRGLIRWAIPYAVGDSYKGRRIVGTTPQLFGVDDVGNAIPAEKIPEFRRGEHYTFAQGRPFAGNKFEAVIGAEVARNTGLKVGDVFHATHGFPGPNDIPDVHPESWTIVGVLNETHTANDRVLFIPLTTFYAIFEHESGLEAINQIKGTAVAPQTPAPPPPSTAESEPSNEGYITNPDGTITPKLPKSDWEISAILVEARSGATLMQLQFLLRNLPDAVGVNPAAVMQEFFERFMSGPYQLLLIIAVLVTVVAAISILVSIYNSVTARYREIAIMRALGATRARILAIVCLEAVLVGLIGGVLGLVVGHALAAGGSVYLQALMGTGIAWWHLGWPELLYLGIVVVVAFLAGLVPAMKAYRTPVAENLVGG
jgi:putative ABC transport system permease protein